MVRVKDPFGVHALKKISSVDAQVVTIMNNSNLSKHKTASAGTEAAGCQEYDITVDDGLTMHGTLCPPSGSTHSDVVVVLVPGATYNHVYWDFPFDPALYSFREAMNRAGWATMVVDRLGTGHSSRPDSALVTTNAQVRAVHGVIQALRHGAVGERSYQTVILGGHSLGAIIAMVESGTYHDADGTLLTGYTHRVDTDFAESLSTHSLYPAAEDPQFSGDGLDPGWLTTRPGTRAAAFYSASTANPQVIAVDEETKDLVSTAEAEEAIALATGSSLSATIEHPVMNATGSNDRIFRVPASNAALEAQERTFFGPHTPLRATVIPGTGHSNALATTARQLKLAVIDWINTIAA